MSLTSIFLHHHEIFIMSVSSQSHSVPVSSLKSIDEGFVRLNDTFLSGKTRDLTWRKEQLKQLQKLIKENQDAIEEALKIDLGRGKMESMVHECIPAVLEIEEALSSIDKGLPQRKWARRLA